MGNSIIIKADALMLNEVTLFKLPRQRYFRNFENAYEIKATDKVPEPIKGKILVNFKNKKCQCRQMVLNPEQDVEVIII